jgi:benzoyl-CoA reductase subunit C
VQAMSKVRTLTKAEEFVDTAQTKLSDLKKHGSKVIGYFCSLTPVEIIDAVGLIPFRIAGDTTEQISEADTHLEAIMCPYVRSCFDLALKGKYDFLDGIVVPHSCDSIERIYNIWRYKLKPNYSHFITVPHVIFDSSYEFFSEELRVFKESLEEYTGNSVTDEMLHRAIVKRNEQRHLLRELYQLRKYDPPLISGTEVMPILWTGTRLPIGEFVESLRNIIDEVKSRGTASSAGNTRLMLVGSEVDDINIIKIIEESGANIVMDDTCVGSRNFWHDVATDIPPLKALAKHYLGDVYCPRTYKGGSAEDRYRYLVDYASDFSCQGVILDIIQYCDTYELDVPSIRDYLEKNSLKVLVIDDAYSSRYVGQLKTRVQAFIELINQGVQ